MGRHPRGGGDRWIPASAGMTGEDAGIHEGRVILADAGIHGGSVILAEAGIDGFPRPRE